MDQPSSMDVPSDIAKRITSAADQLYEESGRTSFPNVDTVRRRARVNMNDASAIMRIWRRCQTASATPNQVAIPDAVHSASQSLLNTIWAVATETANSSLQAAQAGWEQERTEAESCRQQLASAFDSQTAELAALQHNVDALEQRLAAQAVQLQAAEAVAEEQKKVAAAAEARAATAEARSKEIAQRADDLKAELHRAHASADQLRQDSKARLAVAESTIASLHEELRQHYAVESDMREELASMRGRAEATAPGGDTPLAKADSRDSASAKRKLSTASRTPKGATQQGNAGTRDEPEQVYVASRHHQ